MCRLPVHSEKWQSPCPHSAQPDFQTQTLSSCPQIPTKYQSSPLAPATAGPGTKTLSKGMCLRDPPPSLTRHHLTSQMTHLLWTQSQRRTNASDLWRCFPPPPSALHPAMQNSFLSRTSSEKSKLAGGWGRQQKGAGIPRSTTHTLSQGSAELSCFPLKHPALSLLSRWEGGGGVTPRGLERNQRLLMGNANREAGTPVPFLEKGACNGREPSAVSTRGCTTASRQGCAGGPNNSLRDLSSQTLRPTAGLPAGLRRLFVILTHCYLA